MTILRKVGIVGMGAIGAIHVHALCSNQQATISWICDSERSEHQKAVGPATIPWYTNISDALASRNADAVILCTPEETHHSLGLQVLASNHHLLVEKPLALKYTQCEELIKSAQRMNKVLGVGHSMRHDSFFQMVKKGQSTKALTMVTFRRVYASRYWRTYCRVHPVFSLAIHDIDLAVWWSQSRAISIDVSHSKGSNHCPSGFFSAFRMTNGLQVQLDCAEDTGTSNPGLHYAVDLTWEDGMTQRSEHVFHFKDSNFSSLMTAIGRLQDEFLGSLDHDRHSEAVVEHAEAVRIGETIANDW